MEEKSIKKINEELNKALDEALSQLNEMAQIGKDFDGNHKVQVISGDHNAHFIKDDKILFKFRRPPQCPKTIAELELLQDYRASNCTDKELGILLDWFSRDYVTFRGKTIKGETNFERLDDEFEAQNATLNRKF